MLVLGDVMVDHYVTGRVARVSEEAPVPILHVSGERWTPGGAANVAANIAALDGHAVLMGVAGEDPAATVLDALLRGLAPGVDSRIVIEHGRPTTVKTRYMGGQHQVLRVDREQATPIELSSSAALLEGVREDLAHARALVLSDYAKGVLTPDLVAQIIALARASGVPVLVDPKRADWSVYAGASLITPNRRELSQATGLPCETDEQCLLAAERAIDSTGAAILLTRSEKGMSLYRAGAAPRHLAARAREVFDVSGAGDTVAAAMALGLAAGLDMATAMGVANLAAGVVVAKRGTATATREEVLADLRAGEAVAAAAPGAITLEDAIALRRSWAEQGLSVGFANGCFDILHAGHVSLIRQAEAACDRLIMALNTDASVKRLKGPDRPAQNEQARASVMAAMKGVDAVILFDEDTPLEAIRALTPDVLVKGADYSEDAIVGADIVRARGGRILRADLADGHSTTRILNRQKTSGS